MGSLLWTVKMNNGALVEIILLSMQVAFVAMIFALPLAYAVAYLLARFEFRGKALLQALVMLPLVMPPVVTGYLLLIWFGKQGVLGELFSVIGIDFAFKWTGAALAAGLMAFPLLVRPIRLSIEAIDNGLDHAAKTLGASGWTRFRTIILPLSRSGIIAGFVLGFAKALGEFGATITFVSNIPGETETISLAIYSLLQSPSGDRAALTLIVVSVIIAISAVLLSEWLAKRLAHERVS
jgi:molybdate transport system permease protein